LSIFHINPRLNVYLFQLLFRDRNFFLASMLGEGVVDNQQEKYHNIQWLVESPLAAG